VNLHSNGDGEKMKYSNRQREEYMYTAVAISFVHKICKVGYNYAYIYSLYCLLYSFFDRNLSNDCIMFITFSNLFSYIIR